MTDDQFWRVYEEYCLMMNIIENDGDTTTADKYNQEWENQIGSETGIEMESQYANKN